MPIQDVPVLDTGEVKVIERQTYKSKSDGFIIQFPTTRTFQENVYGASVVFSSPVSETDTIKENVSIVKKTLDKPYSLAEYYAITKPGLIKLIPGFTEISNQTIKVNDLDAQKLIYTWTNIWTQWVTQLKREQVYLIKNQAVYILSYTATKATFDDYAQKVDEMVSTLEIK